MTTLTIQQADERRAALEQQISETEAHQVELEGRLTASYLDGGHKTATLENQLAAIPARLRSLRAAVEVMNEQRHEAEREQAVSDYEPLVYASIAAECKRRDAVGEVERIKQQLEAAERTARELSGRAADAAGDVRRGHDYALKLGASEAELSAQGRAAAERAREQGISLT